jgi:hypothetical protein
MTPAVQTLLVALIVLACAWNAFRRHAPRLAWRLQARLAFAFEAPGRPAALRRIGQWLRPSVPVVTGCGSGASSACAACGSCAPAPADAAPAAWTADLAVPGPAKPGPSHRG